MKVRNLKPVLAELFEALGGKIKAMKKARQRWIFRFQPTLAVESLRKLQYVVHHRIWTAPRRPWQMQLQSRCTDDMHGSKDTVDGQDPALVDMLNVTSSTVPSCTKYLLLCPASVETNIFIQRTEQFWR